MPGIIVLVRKDMYVCKLYVCRLCVCNNVEGAVSRDPLHRRLVSYGGGMYGWGIRIPCTSDLARVILLCVRGCDRQIDRKYTPNNGGK